MLTGLRRLLPAAANRALLQVAGRTQKALRHGEVAAAIREVDRAWRSLPEHAQSIAPAYARLLALEGRDQLAALRMLARAAEYGPDPELEALTVRTLLRLGRDDEASRRLVAALGAFCLVPGETLSQVAEEALQGGGVSAAGWVGITPELDFVWQLSAGRKTSPVQVEAGGHVLPAKLASIMEAGGRQYFRLRPPQALRGGRFHFRVDGAPLLGSGCSARPDFALDGRSWSAARSVLGWARLGWAPSLPLRLRLDDDHGRHAWVKTRSDPRQDDQPPFHLDLRTSGLRGGRFRISAQLPDGRLEALPDTPLLLESAVRLPASARHSGRTWPAGARAPRVAGAPVKRRAPADVIVPVFGAREETLACLRSVLATVTARARVVVVDDASDDPALVCALDDLAAAGRITLLRNSSNLGFVASVNRALAQHPAHDAVLLNSDAVVFGDWLERLRAAAYGAAKVGTVTPFTNSGSIASYPDQASEPLGAGDAAALDRIAASENSGATAEIPVGVGSCLYLRRDCLVDVGAFDQAVFARGYGEETDYCLRARARGWSHRLAGDVFVFHAGGRSFGKRRAALLDRSQRLLNLRHPGYDAFISRFLEADPVRPLRRKLDEGRLRSLDGNFVLIVTLALTGGVDRFVAERCRAIRAGGSIPLVLRPAEAARPDAIALWTDAPAVPNLRYAIPADLPAVRRLLESLRIERVEIQHFLHLDARVVELARSLGRPYDVMMHDYAWVCPRVTLIDGSGRYCGEPPVAVCEACVRKNGSSLGEAISVAALRRRSARWLHAARFVSAPSADTASRYQRHFAGLPVRVEPLGPQPAAEAHPPPADANEPVRVALIGAIGQHKGYRVLLDCARDAVKRRLPLQFVVIGYTQSDPPLLKTGKVFVTGRYTEGEVAHLLQRERPHLALMPSVWPETWCYALDHALRAGLPVVAFDVGAIAERLRAAQTGTLLPLDSDARQINDRILRVARGSGVGDPKELLNMNDPKAQAATQDLEGLSASVQVLPLPVGLYLFSVRAATPTVAEASAGLSLPAIHVGLGPGVRTEQVEFVAGPGTNGTWLFAQGDMLVAKVVGAGATLILTSIRAPGGEALSIAVERLENRVDSAVAHAAEKKPAAVKSAARSPAPPAAAAVEGESLPLQIRVHMRARGDRTFINEQWAGRTGPGLWIESFSVQPLGAFGARDIEYKGLTASGFETPWISDDLMCGTRGMAVPLIGFAVRLKPGPETPAYDCEYSGYFQSGTVSGPFRNGTPCRSTAANDPLEGLQIRIVKRASPARPPATAQAALAEPRAPAKALARAGKAAAPAPSKRGAAARRRKPARTR